MSHRATLPNAKLEPGLRSHLSGIVVRRLKLFRSCVWGGQPKGMKGECCKANQIKLEINL